MLNKTLRSVLSLAVVFCLMLGMSGNAIALAVSNPVDGALAPVDTKVYGTIDELNAMIDDLEAQIDTLEAVLLEGEDQLAEGKQLLEDAKQMLADVEAGDLKDANEKLADAQQKLADAKAKIAPENLPELREEAYAEAMEEFESKKAEKIEEARQEWEEKKAEKIAEARQEWEEKKAEKIAEARDEWETKKAEKIAEAREEWETKKAEKIAEAVEKWNTRLEEARAEAQAKFDEEFDKKWNEEMAKADAKFEDTVAREKMNAADEYEAKKDAAYADFLQATANLPAGSAAYQRAYEEYIAADAAAYADYEAAVAQAEADARAQWELDKIEAEEEAYAKAQAEFDAKFAEEVEKKEAEATAEYYQKLADAEAEATEEYYEKLAEAEAEATEKYYEKLAEAEAEATEEYYKRLAEKEAEATEEYYKRLAEAEAEATEKYYEKLAEAMVEFEETFEKEFNETLAEAQETLAKAETELKKVEEYVGNINEAVAGYKQTIADAEAMIAEAELMIVDAKVAIAKARETIEQARTLVNNLEKTYTELRVAVANPQPSVSYIRDTVANLEANYFATWEALLELDKDIDELIATYDVLAQYEIGAISVEPFYQPAVDIEAIQMEVNGTVYGIEAMTLPEVKVEYEFGFDGIAIPELPETVNSLNTTLDEIIAKGITLNAAITYYVAAAKAAVAKALEVAGAAAEEIEQVLGISFNGMKSALSYDLHIVVYNWLYNNPDVVCGVVKEFGVFGLELLVQYGPYALDLLQNNADLATIGLKLAIGGTYLTATLGAAVLGYVGDKLDFLSDYKDDVMKAAGKLYAKYGDEAKALIEVYVDYLGLRERYEDAIQADYTIFHDSLYLAIGDGTAISGGYTDKLAEMMEIPHMSANLAELDLTVEEAIALVQQNAELVGKADLITLGFSNLPASFAVMNALADNYDADFTDKVGNVVNKSIDKVVSEVTEFMAKAGIGQDKIDLVNRAGEMVHSALSALRNRLIAEGLDEATINMVMEATEVYAVAYLSRVAWYPCLVNTVQEVNPDAQIVIVGTYNDLEGVVVEAGGREINIGEYVKYMTAAANLENLVQAFFEENVIYVHASAVETVFEENDYEGLNNLGYLMSMLNDEMLPSEAGHAYIAEQIYNALNIEYKILGDVNGDRKVDCRDARLILKYTAGQITADELDLSMADVNGDGKVNTRDARLVLRLRVGQIEHFPVCNQYEE